MTPVIFLTAMNTFAHKKKGFETGVDDYMTKPIDYEELKWRMKALLRRAKIANEKQLTVGNLVLRTDCLTAECNGLPVTLTKRNLTCCTSCSPIRTLFSQNSKLWTRSGATIRKATIIPLRRTSADCGINSVNAMILNWFPSEDLDIKR